MLLTTLQKLYNRDLDRLKDQLKQYKTEEAIWQLADGINNPAGNLCLHLVGNLNHFIGTVLGNTGFVRQRDLEFTRKNVPRSELLEMIDQTKEAVYQTLDKLTTESLAKEYPIDIFKNQMTVEYFLIHLSSHLTYHTGQIDYHRRILGDK